MTVFSRFWLTDKVCLKKSVPLRKGKNKCAALMTVDNLQRTAVLPINILSDNSKLFLERSIILFFELFNGFSIFPNASK